MKQLYHIISYHIRLQYSVCETVYEQRRFPSADGKRHQLLMYDIEMPQTHFTILHLSSLVLIELMVLLLWAAERRRRRRSGWGRGG